jgi:hypothetical protein
MRGKNAREGSRRAIRKANKRQQKDFVPVSDALVIPDPTVALTIRLDHVDLKLVKRPSLYPCEVVCEGKLVGVAVWMDLLRIDRLRFRGSRTHEVHNREWRGLQHVSIWLLLVDLP